MFLSNLGELHMLPQNWHHYILISFCQATFLMNLIHSPHNPNHLIHDCEIFKKVQESLNIQGGTDQKGACVPQCKIMWPLKTAPGNCPTSDVLLASSTQKWGPNADIIDIPSICSLLTRPMLLFPGLDPESLALSQICIPIGVGSRTLPEWLLRDSQYGPYWTLDVR